MNQNYQLCSPWCVWLGYFVPEDQSTKAGYNDTLKKVHVIKSYNDLIYYWQESRFKHVRQILVQEHDEKQNTATSFQIDGKSRSISALNYFREGINPTWEDENNANGGRLVFQIDKEIDKFQEIYEWLIFYFLGESESCAQDINGIRFISHKLNAPFRFHYRVEVWTKFNNSELEKVSLFQETFVKDFFKQFLSVSNLKKNFKPVFKNNKEDPKEDKEKKQINDKESKPKN